MKTARTVVMLIRLPGETYERAQRVAEDTGMDMECTLIYLAEVGLEALHEEAAERAQFEQPPVERAEPGWRRGRSR